MDVLAFYYRRTVSDVWMGGCYGGRLTWLYFDVFNRLSHVYKPTYKPSKQPYKLFKSTYKLLKSTYKLFVKLKHL